MLFSEFIRNIPACIFYIYFLCEQSEWLSSPARKYGLGCFAHQLFNFHNFKGGVCMYEIYAFFTAVIFLYTIIKNRL